MIKKNAKTKQNKLRLHNGDQVIVIAGKDKGKQGRIKSVNTAKRRVTVENVNMVVKHMRPNPQRGIQGGLVKREAAIDVSNVAIVNPETGKADKISYQIDENGNKTRVYRSDSSPVEQS